MKNYNLVTPEGMRDTFSDECRKLRKLEGKFGVIAENLGYSEIGTPIFEFYDVFNHSSLNFPQEMLYKFTDNKGRLLVLRPDSSLPIARSVATSLRNNPLPLRLFYSQDVFRANKSNTGKSNCFSQVGAELFGKIDDSEFKTNMEIINFALEFMKFCCEDFTFEIGHVGIFNDLTKNFKENRDFENLDKIRKLVETKNVPELNALDISENLKLLPKFFGGGEIFQNAKNMFNNDILAEIESIFNAINKSNIIIDLGLVNSINYYTGLCFKGYIGGKEVLSGGRYDKLVRKFGRDIPAVGFSVYLDNLKEVYND